MIISRERWKLDADGLSCIKNIASDIGYGLLLLFANITSCPETTPGRTDPS